MFYKILTLSLIIILFISLYLQIAATLLIIQSSEKTISKLIQLVMVWTIPIIGAIFISYFRLEDYHNRNHTISRLYTPLLLITGKYSEHNYSNQPSNSAHDKSDDIWAED